MKPVFGFFDMPQSAPEEGYVYWATDEAGKPLEFLFIEGECLNARYEAIPLEDTRGPYVPVTGMGLGMEMLLASYEINNEQARRYLGIVEAWDVCGQTSLAPHAAWDVFPFAQDLTWEDAFKRTICRIKQLETDEIKRVSNSKWRVEGVPIQLMERGIIIPSNPYTRDPEHRYRNRDGHLVADLELKRLLLWLAGY